jgi:hypothetical protein
MSDPSETTATPEATQTEAVATETAGQVTETPTSQPDETTFFDPKEIPPELQPAYKQMQRAFTKKTQEIAKARGKVEAYDAFERDPVGSLQRIAGQMGYSLSRAEAKALQDQQSKGDDLSDWQPQTWQEVLVKAEERAVARIRQEQQGQFEPVLNEIKGLRRNQIEKVLDDEVPEWRQYEDEMSTLLQDHPSLIKDPVRLARLAIPDEVWQSKAMQAAMKRLQSKTSSAQTSSGSTTRQEPSAKPKGNMTFQQAYEQAKKQLGSGKGVA